MSGAISPAFEAIYWKPQITWVIDRIHVLRPVRFTNIRRNEVKQKIPERTAKSAMMEGKGRLGFYVDEGDNRQQRAATILRDVTYVLQAHLEQRGDGDRPEKHSEMFRRRASKGCKNFFDIRAFGAVMTTEVNCGQVRGPVQFAMARSIDPIVSQEHAVTRCAVTNEKDLEKERTMGRKFTVPYGLYCAHGYINPHLAEQTGFGEEDLSLFWKSLEQMFEYDRSAARGEMAARRLIVFKHESDLGNAPAHKLFERISCKLINGSNGDWTPPRRFEDYRIDVDDKELPSGITIEQPF